MRARRDASYSTGSRAQPLDEVAVAMTSMQQRRVRHAERQRGAASADWGVFAGRRRRAPRPGRRRPAPKSGAKQVADRSAPGRPSARLPLSRECLDSAATAGLEERVEAAWTQPANRRRGPTRRSPH